MAFSDDALLTVAKEIFLSRAEPRNYAMSSKNDDEYLKRTNQLADDFNSFYRALRERLSDVQ